MGKLAEPPVSLKEIQEAARKCWREEVDETESFVAAWVREGNGETCDEDRRLLKFIRDRPSLKQVSLVLSEFITGDLK